MCVFEVRDMLGQWDNWGNYVTIVYIFLLRYLSKDADDKAQKCAVVCDDCFF